MAVPENLLYNPAGGSTGIGIVLGASYSHVSPLVLSGLYNAKQAEKEFRGEKLSVNIIDEAGSRGVTSNGVPIYGHENPTMNVVESVYKQRQSTASPTSSNAAVIGDHYQRGYSGTKWSSGSMSSTESLVDQQLGRLLQMHVAAVTEGIDTMLFLSIWADNYRTKSNNTGSAMTTVTETWANSVTQSPLVWNFDLTAAASGDELQKMAFDVDMFFKMSTLQKSGTESQKRSKGPIYVVLPEFAFNNIVTLLTTHGGRDTAIVNNVNTSDGFRSHWLQHTAFINGINFISMPYDLFYTVGTGTGADTVYLGFTCTQDAISFSVPNQNGSLSAMIGHKFNRMPGNSIFDGFNQAQIEAILRMPETWSGPTPIFGAGDFRAIDDRYSDPVLAGLEGAVRRRYFGGENAPATNYSPLALGVYSYNLPPNTLPLISYSTSFMVNAYGTSVRAKPKQIIPLHIPTKYFIGGSDFEAAATPFTASNPYTPTIAALDNIGDNTAQATEYLKVREAQLNRDLAFAKERGGLYYSNQDTDFEGRIARAVGSANWREVLARKEPATNQSELDEQGHMRMAAKISPRDKKKTASDRSVRMTQESISILDGRK